MDAIKMSDMAVFEVASWYNDAEDKAEMIRELCTRLLRHLGLWSLTIPLEALAVLLTKGKVAVALIEDCADDPGMPNLATLHFDITTDCLVVSQQPARLGTLAGLSSAERKVIINECSQACSFLDQWLWVPDKVEVQFLMHTMIWEVSSILRDVESYLVAVETEDHHNRRVL